ncbi:unnamed protein product [Candida verbasci]|uniref:Uncharacterized protein n=1 Tax=Candida verbasci TaxID=1227364 RepID=A0A9W4TSN8_9ASCO|nr:unnamed protein product [Candida verbasci]
MSDLLSLTEDEDMRMKQVVNEEETQEQEALIEDTPLQNSFSDLENELEQQLKIELKEEFLEEQQSEEIPEITDDLTFEDLQKVYNQYQNKFKLAYSKSKRLFDSEKNQRLTLYYMHRRNQILLNILADSEGGELIEGRDINDEEIFHILNKLDDKSISSSFDELISKGKIDKNLIFNLYLTEKIPDLINDDLINCEINPLNTENWCIRNLNNLVNLKHKPITIEDEEILDEYKGKDFNLGLYNEIKDQEKDIMEEIPIIQQEININASTPNTKKKRKTK